MTTTEKVDRRKGKPAKTGLPFFHVLQQSVWALLMGCCASAALAQSWTITLEEPTACIGWRGSSASKR
jgi:hypothetical protein